MNTPCQRRIEINSWEFLRIAVVALHYSCVLPSACVFSSPIDAFNPDYKQYPKFRQAKAISFTQEAGDLFIIPTGWFHQVRYHIKINVVTLEAAGFAPWWVRVLRTSTQLAINWS